MDSSALGEFFEANELLGDAALLRARMASDGYLFFRNIVPVETLVELRDDITTILAELGWIKSGEARMRAEAQSLPYREGDPGYLEALDRIVRLESLHSLAHQQNLMEVMRQTLGASAFPHPLSIVRMVFPHAPELATPPHQDYPNNQGTENLTAAWVPLGDCSTRDGALAIMEGSHKFGVFPLQFHLGAGNRGAILSPELASCRWLGANFKAGDIVLFQSKTVHRALDNCSPISLRLSVDFRYQLEGEAMTEGCLEPHFGRIPWGDIYRGWKSDQFQYYWRDKKYTLAPWDQSLQDVDSHGMDDAVRQEMAYKKAVKKRYKKHIGELKNSDH